MFHPLKVLLGSIQDCPAKTAWSTDILHIAYQRAAKIGLSHDCRHSLKVRKKTRQIRHFQTRRLMPNIQTIIIEKE
jgi:hypothetical protein